MKKVLEKYKGIEFKKDSFYDNGEYYRAKLAKATIIDGNEYRASDIEFYYNGYIKRGYLLKDTYINGIKFKSLYHIDFYDNGQVKMGFLKKDSFYQGINFKNWNWMSFYPDGQVKDGALAGNQVINGIEYLDNGFDIYFYPNGQVKSGNIAVEQIVQGIKFPEFDILFFLADGSLDKKKIARDRILCREAMRNPKGIMDGNTFYYALPVKQESVTIIKE